MFNNKNATNPFNLEKGIQGIIKSAEDFIDWKKYISPSKVGKFKTVLKSHVTEEENRAKREELTQKGFIDKYGIDSEDYIGLNWRKASGLESPYKWRWTDTRMENAIRQLSNSTRNKQLISMLQNHAGTIQPKRRRGPTTKI